VDAITKGKSAAPAGFTSAPVVDVGDAFVLPGLIDLHNHLGYNALPLWVEPTQKTPFLNHNQWPGAPSYRANITWTSSLLAEADPEALMAYVQTRAIVGGTTSIQGWPACNRPPDMILRDIDSEEAGTKNRNLVFTSVITETVDQLARTARSMAGGAGFIYHCSEGQQGSVVAAEYTNVAKANCLGKKLIAIHCNAVSDADWKLWKATDAGAVVWSPFSNLWLYGTTTNIPAAKKQGVTICLGPDWGPSGTKQVLGEIKVAKLVSQKQGFGLSDQDLVEMITSNAGDVLERCWSKQVGRLTQGSFGDVTVLRPKGKGDVWSQVVNATEREVMLVVVGGKARYGDAATMKAAKAGPMTTLSVGGKDRGLAIIDPTDNTKAFEWTDVLARLEAVRKDPAGSLKKKTEKDTHSLKLGAAAKAPLELTLDMPAGSAVTFEAMPADPSKVVIPPLPTLVHDKAFFDFVHGHGFHGGLLDGLAAFYKSGEL
jgi:5-methylthioadenosine/S-adenosylhomocysteine deaminase